MFIKNKLNENSRDRADRTIGIAMRGIGFLYLILGILKVHGLLFPTVAMEQYLTLSNPVLFILKNSIVFYFVAVAEIIIGGYLAIARKSPFKYGLLFWMLGMAFCYKICLIIVDYNGPCGCLLGIDHFLPISSSLQNTISDIILLATLAFTLSSLIFEYRLKSKTNRTSSSPPGSSLPSE